MRASLLVAAALLLVGPAYAQDLSVVSSALSNAQPGGPIVYFIIVRNAGAAAATNVTFTDVIPPNTAFIAAGYSSSAVCSTPAVGSAGTFTCTMAALSGSTQFLLEVQVDAAAQQGTII